MKRLLRRIIGALLGEPNAIKLYGEKDEARDFEQYAKETGLAVVAHDLATGNESFLVWVVNPSPHAKKEHPQEHQSEILLSGCDAGNHSASPDKGECVPPILKLKPGEKIIHILDTQSHTQKSLLSNAKKVDEIQAQAEPLNPCPESFNAANIGRKSSCHQRRHTK